MVRAPELLWPRLPPQPAGGLGDGPPELGDDTTLLSVFDAAGLAGSAATGFEFDDALAGPPQPSEPAPAVVGRTTARRLLVR